MFVNALVALALVAHPIGSGPLVPLAHSAAPAQALDSAVHRRVTFGVAIAPVPAAVRHMAYLNADEGVVLTQVDQDGAAAAADLRAGDLVLAIGGKRVDETTLFATIRGQTRDEPFRVEFLRDGKWHDTWVTIEK